MRPLRNLFWILAGSSFAIAQSDGPFQVHYAANLAPVQTQHAQGPIAWYSFDSPGNVGFDSVSGNNGTPVNVTQVPGVIGQAASFQNGYITLPTTPQFDLRSGDFSLTVFVKGSVASNNRNWFTKGYPLGGPLCQHLYGLGGPSTVGFGFDGGPGGSAISTTNVFDGQWHHVSGIKRGNIAEIWVDGKLEGTGTITGSADGGTFGIGRLGNGCEFFNGQMDEAKVWNRALSRTEVAAEALILPGDSVFNFTNTGVNTDPVSGIGDICVNAYTFASDEQLASCCSCKITRNALWSLSANRDLISNILTPDPTIGTYGIVVKLLATLPGTGGTCDPAHPGSTTQGLAAWGTTFHAILPSPVGSVFSAPIGYFGTETPFTNSKLNSGEQALMASYCGFIKANGSGYGICKSCQTGALGTPNQNLGLGADKQ